jgi:hypothetical protein
MLYFIISLRVLTFLYVISFRQQTKRNLTETCLLDWILHKPTRTARVCVHRVQGFIHTAILCINLQLKNLFHELIFNKHA